jgi:hypothetical protein
MHSNFKSRDQRSLEYTSLRQELSQNRQYIFERPLFIVTLLGAALIQFKNDTYLAILPFLVIVTLWINLFMMANLLWSSSRIAAYIEVVLEPCSKVKWIGWEKDLRKNRIWVEKNRDKLKDIVKGNGDSSAVPDLMSFYAPVVVLHFVIMAIAFLLSIFLICIDKTPQADCNLSWLAPWISTALNNWNLFWFLLSLLGTIISTYLYVYKNDSRNYSTIEDQRAIWLAVFSHDDEEIKRKA